ncbi:MAG: DUF3987 domain-containing protein, partial [Bacteroidales bacterium]|nr:DUF3987 domain-containing protein [Bacteroidales bacterium]
MLNEKQSPCNMTVSIFSSTAPAKDRSAIYQHGYKAISNVLLPTGECTVKAFLQLGHQQYKDTIDHIRSIDDKNERNRLKTTLLPSGSLSVRLSTRESSQPLEKRIIQYNPLLVLDFDNLPDIEAAKQALSSLPYIYYAGLSVSGRGLFAIIPIAAQDHTEHKTYFHALEKEMQTLGLTIDKACKDVTRLRVVSYDTDPYINPDCTTYTLPQPSEPQEPTDELPQDQETEEDLTALKLEEHLQIWEEKQHPLDDYDQWITVGMALSRLGEPGREPFHRVSRYSDKYTPETTDKAFDGFLRSTKHITLGSFFYICHINGIRPANTSEYESIPFPDPIRHIIDSTKACLNFPADYICPALIFASSIALGNALAVEIKKGWTEKAIFYMAIVGEPGTNKSSCLEFAIEPLRKIDRDNLKTYKKKLKQYEATKNDPDKAIEQPVYGQIVLSDITVEGFLKQHLNTPRGLAIYADELMGFVKSFSRYRSGNDEEVWTQLFTGVPIIVNRLHSDSFSVSSPFVGIIGGVQPGMLRKFADGKTESGFIYRWLFAYPDKRTFSRFQDDEIDDEILSRWNTIIDTIRKIRYNGKTTVIRLSPEAYDLYKQWYNTGRETMEHASTSYIGITTKMERYCARFSLILEVLRYTCGQSDLTSISAQSMKDAFKLTYYFIAGAQKALKKFHSDPLGTLT